VEVTHEAPGSSRDIEQGYNMSLCAPSCLLQNISLAMVSCEYLQLTEKLHFIHTTQGRIA
jgi:hypothetical protein